MNATSPRPTKDPESSLQASHRSRWSHHPAPFIVCTVLALFACFWAYVWYTASSIIYSDLPRYGISRQSEAYTEIVNTTQRHAICIGAPIAAVLIISLCAWGWQLSRPYDDQRAKSIAEQTSEK